MPKMSEYPAATIPLVGTEEALVVQGGATKKVAVAEFAGVGNLWTMNKSASQTLTSGASDPITWDTAVIDGGDSVIDLVNNRFVSPATGLYMAYAVWLWEAAGPANSAYMDVLVGGVSAATLGRTNGNSFGTGGHNAMFPLSLTAGDAVTLTINPGAQTGVTARGNASVHLATSFTLQRVA